MQCLVDLKNLINRASKTVKVLEGGGSMGHSSITLPTTVGEFSLVHDQYYLDDKEISQKEIRKLIGVSAFA